MADVLRVARTLEMPIEYVTQTGGLLAVRGAGKSNAGRVMAEEMFHAGLPFCAVDPVGSWYGLRSGRDGTSNGGLPVFIFGGAHGDVSINKDAGALVADVVVDQRLTCIVDLSGFEDDKDKKRFLLAFSKRLYFKNKDPLHLFLEEADDYVPQDMSDADRPLIKAWEDIVRRGRSRGIGCTIITQRSAAINKKVLTQVENLFVLRTTGPQDIKAIAEWVKYHKVKEELLESLASLEDGEAWVWSPHFMKVTKKFRFRVSNTFDSGATPKNYKGKTARKVATLRDVDVKKLNDRISETIEKVKSEDPTALRVEVSKLKAIVHSQQKELERALQRPVTPPVNVTKLKKAQQAVEQGLTDIRNSASYISSALSTPLADLLQAPMEKEMHRQFSVNVETSRTQSIVPNVTNPRRKEVAGDSKLGACPRALLAVLVARYPKPTTLTATAIMAKYSSTSGGVANSISQLRTLGYVEGPGSSLLATDKGIAFNGPAPDLGTGDALIEYWKTQVGACERALLAVLAEQYPQALPRVEIATMAGYQPSSGGVANAFSKLKTLELITSPEKGMFKLSEDFYAK